MGFITRIGDKSGTLGTIVSAMACGACFPAIASLGAAIGLGFLSQYEGVFITRLLPFFAALALLANALGYLSHKQWYRSALGMIGPLIVLTTALFLIGNWWTERLLYTGFAFMIAVSVWDLIAPANRHCPSGAGELPPTRQ